MYYLFKSIFRARTPPFFPRLGKFRENDQSRSTGRMERANERGRVQVTA